jgi:ribose 5-phosphate isomerase B
MIIYIGADHRGFSLKEQIKKSLSGEAYTVIDVGAAQVMPDDDFPDYAAKVAEGVAKNPGVDRGIVICGSGFGVDIAANKFRGIRSGLAATSDQIYQGRHDDDVNVLALAASFVDEVMAQKIVKTFLATPFAKEERYTRRLEKISKLEI